MTNEELIAQIEGTSKEWHLISDMMLASCSNSLKYRMECNAILTEGIERINSDESFLKSCISGFKIFSVRENPNPNPEYADFVEAFALLCYAYLLRHSNNEKSKQDVFNLAIARKKYDDHGVTKHVLLKFAEELFPEEFLTNKKDYESTLQHKIFTGKNNMLRQIISDLNYDFFEHTQDENEKYTLDLYNYFHLLNEPNDSSHTLDRLIANKFAEN